MRLNRFGRLACALVGATTMLAACQATMRVQFSPDAQFVTKLRVDLSEGAEALPPSDRENSCKYMFGSLVDASEVDKIENVGTADMPICELSTKPAPISKVADPEPPHFKAELTNGTYTVTWQGGGLGIIEGLGPDGEAGGQAGSLTLEFEFPGSVQEASGGEIDGNLVRYTDLKPFAQPGKIVASAKESGLLGGKMPWWLLALGGLAVIAVIAALALRRRPYGQPPAVPGGYPPAGGPGGYPPPGYGPGGQPPVGPYDGGQPPTTPPSQPPVGPYDGGQPPTTPLSQPPVGPYDGGQPPTTPPSQP